MVMVLGFFMVTRIVMVVLLKMSMYATNARP